MGKRNINFILSIIIIFIILLISKVSHAETEVENLEIDINEEELVAGKNVGSSIKKDKPTAETKKVKVLDNSQLISSKIPMPLEHQEYLFTLCNDRGIDYVLMLSLIKQESEFTANRISKTNDYGYMQINQINHDRMVRELKTDRAPLDPYVNINWGTHMIAKLNNKFKAQGYTGDKLNRAVLSAYNKGEGGFKRTGEATAYLNRINKEQKWVKKTLGI